MERVMKRRPGNMFGAPQSPQERYDAIVGEIVRVHNEGIRRRWEWMAAQAVIDGKVILEGEAYPRLEVDFQRDAGHTITLGAGSRWGEANVSILDNIQTWGTTMRKAHFGGAPNRLTIGADVWDVMRKDEEIKDLLKQDFRAFNNGLNINLGLRQGLDVEYLGRLSSNLDLYLYSDYYHADDGTVTPFMSAKDVVLTSPNINGVQAFGAILDKQAQFRPLPIFPKMWEDNDPPATFIMHQSAPLMVPVNPNASLKATVLA